MKHLQHWPILGAIYLEHCPYISLGKLTVLRILLTIRTYYGNKEKVSVVLLNSQQYTELISKYLSGEFALALSLSLC